MIGPQRHSCRPSAQGSRQAQFLRGEKREQDEEGRQKIQRQLQQEVVSVGGRQAAYRREVLLQWQQHEA